MAEQSKLAAARGKARYSQSAYRQQPGMPMPGWLNRTFVFRSVARSVCAALVAAFCYAPFVAMGASERLAPIFMTAMATGLALVPIALVLGSLAARFRLRWRS